MMIFRRIFYYVQVRFPRGRHSYTYKTEDKSIRVGTIVMVKAGTEIKTAIVTGIGLPDGEELPCPPEQIKRIIGKANGWSRKLFIEADASTQEETTMRRDNRKTERAINNARWIVRTHLFRRDEYICSVCDRVSDKPYEVCPYCQIPRKKKLEYHATWVDEIECMSAALDDDW